MTQELTELIPPEAIERALQGFHELIKREQDLHAATMLEAAKVVAEVNARRDILLQYIKEASSERSLALAVLLAEIRQSSQEGSVEKYEIAMQSLVGHLRTGLVEQVEKMDRQLRDGTFQFKLGKASNV